MEKPFNPDYCVLPGLTVADAMQDKELTVATMAERSGQTEEYVWGVITGAAQITEAFAQSLSEILGASATFWINRQRNFDEGKEAGKSITGWPDKLGEPCIPVTLCRASRRTPPPGK